MLCAHLRVMVLGNLVDISCFQGNCKNQIITISLNFQDPVLYLEHGKCSVNTERQREEEKERKGMGMGS